MSRLGWLDRLWTGIADRGRAFTKVPASTLSGVARAQYLANQLLSQAGEASGAAVARDLLQTLRALTQAQRLDIMLSLSEAFGPDETALQKAAQAYLTDPSLPNAAQLHQASEPPRQELLRRMNMAPGGTATLVTLRQELLPHLKAHPALRILDHDLHHLFTSWFNRGFLELRRIDWDTPAAILEKLIRYEAVHEIQGWDDLRRRLLPDRRCFAFFHQALPNEPLIFVEVALTQGLASAVQPLLAPAAPTAPAPDTAIFYSISNCQDGLRGVSFGNFLIKQVVEDLKAELPSIKFFATLSPVPGFTRWLTQEASENTLAEDETEALQATKAENWWQTEAASTHKPALLRLAATYLTRPASAAGFDPVAKFHLGNGARLERINYLGNTAPKGLRESLGIMVNYLYDPEKIEANHESFVSTGSVARSPEVESLMRRPKKPKAVQSPAMPEAVAP